MANPEPEKKRHFPISDDVADYIIFVLDHGSGVVTKFEYDVALDRGRGYAKYGAKAVITGKQLGIIKSAYRRLKLKMLTEGVL